MLQVEGTEKQQDPTNQENTPVRPSGPRLFFAESFGSLSQSLVNRSVWISAF